MPLSWGRDDPARKPRPAAEPRKLAEPPSRGPHLDDLRRELRARATAVLLRPHGRGIRLKLLGAGVAAVGAVWAGSGVYEVGADQTAVITRLGVVVGQAGPGVHYHLPAPIGQVQTLSTAGVNQLEIGSPDRAAASAADTGRQMSTRDGKLVDVTYSVQWRITDPLRYVSRAADQDASLGMAAEAAMSEAVGQAPLADVLGPERARVAAQATILLRRAVAREDAGVEIVDVLMRDAHPPEGADAGFHAIADANTQAQAALNGAEGYRSRLLADARGDAAKVVQTSQGYRDQEVSEAKGEAERFALVDAQYRKAPDVTRERLYSETMERVLHNVRKVVVQTPKDGGQIVLPAEAFRGKAPDAAPTPPASTQSGQGGDAGSGAPSPQGDGAKPSPANVPAQPADAAPAATVQAGGGVA